jgi:cytochrome c-type biogenesis protein CcmH/NrfF
MKTLATLGRMTGGFLLNPPPRAAVTTLLWLGSRSHPAVTVLVTLAMLAAWRRPDG